MLFSNTIITTALILSYHNSNRKEMTLICAFPKAPCGLSPSWPWR